MRCLIAGSGPSLTPEVAAQCSGSDVIAVNDAVRVINDARTLYSSDIAWWRKYHSLPFTGRKIGCAGLHNDADNLRDYASWGVELIYLDHGPCSGYAAINLAVHLGYTRIGLTGFDMCRIGDATHFYGCRTDGLRDNGEYHLFLADFDKLAKRLKSSNISVENCTPGSALTAFPQCSLADFIA